MLGAIAWREHRVGAAALGALAGTALNAALPFFCFRSCIALADGLAGASLLALQVSFPGMILGGMAAAWRFGERWVVAAVAGAASGGVAWLGGWSYFN